ncbi:MAG: hypothetical protein QOG87_1494 [Actinomycetota bacterium]
MPLACLAVVLCAVGTVGCKAEGGKDRSPARATGNRTTTTARAALEAYCSAALGFATVEPPEIDDAASEAEQTTQLQQYASATLKPAADDLATDAPDEITSDVNVVVAAVDEMATSGDPAAYDNDTVELARGRLHRFELEHCDLATETVTMADFSFSAIDGVKAGSVSFDASNDGEEYHELAIIAKRPSTTLSFDQILALDDAATQQRHATYVGGIEPVAPGDTGFTVVDLRAGDYLVACFLPVGSTPEQFESDSEPSGDPHTARGMKREFKVS